MSRRGIAAGAVLVLWLGGLAELGRRELFRGADQRLEEASLRVTPGRLFYMVEQDGRHVGYAVSAIDTVVGGIQITDEFAADIANGDSTRHLQNDVVTRLTRGLRLRDIRSTAQAGGDRLRTNALLLSDSLLRIITSRDSIHADTQRFTVASPLIAPALIPIAVALGGRVKVGRSVELTIFDPVSRAPQAVTLTVDAESLFVVDDSVSQDTVTKLWTATHSDTVRAWRIGSTAPGAFSGWVDAEGRVVAATDTTGLTLKRTAFDLAYSNWHPAGAASSQAPVIPARAPVIPAQAGTQGPAQGSEFPRSQE